MNWCAGFGFANDNRRVVPAGFPIHSTGHCGDMNDFEYFPSLRSSHELLLENAQTDP